MNYDRWLEGERERWENRRSCDEAEERQRERDEYESDVNENDEDAIEDGE